MQETIYLIATRTKIENMLKRPPTSLCAGEYVLGITVTVPGSVFINPPIPVIEIELTPPQIGTARIVVDGQETEQSIDAATVQQRAVLRHLSELILAGRKSSDPFIADRAGAALEALIDAGVEVRITEDTERGDA